MDGDVRINPYLSGNFAPVRTEDDFVAKVKGEIPRELRGTLYRTGPNPQFEPRDPNYHWFTGDGMIHAFRVEDGKVTYKNRYVRTPKWTLEHEHGRSLFGGFNPMLTDPIAQGKDSGVANTNIVSHAGRLLALEEGHMPFELEHGTLNPLGYVEAYKGRVTAHPKMDPKTGQMVWFGYGVGEMPLSAGMSYGVTDAAGSQPSICAGVRAPTIAPVTPGKPRVHAAAAAAVGTPWRSATCARASATRRFAWSSVVNAGADRRQSSEGSAATRSAVNAPVSRPDPIGL